MTAVSNETLELLRCEVVKALQEYASTEAALADRVYGLFSRSGPEVEAEIEELKVVVKALLESYEDADAAYRTARLRPGNFSGGRSS